MLRKALKFLMQIKSETCAAFTASLALFLVACLSGCGWILVANIVGSDIRENTYRNPVARNPRISDSYLSDIFGWVGFFNAIWQGLVATWITKKHFIRTKTHSSVLSFEIYSYQC